MGLLEEWKLRGEVNARRKEQEVKMKEREELVRRGKLEGMSREEVLEAHEDMKDFLDLVGRTERLFGVERNLAVGFCVDVACRKIERGIMGIVGELDKKVGVKNLRGLKENEENGKLEEESLKKFKVVEEGRTFGEVIKGVGPGMKAKEMGLLEAKMEGERRVESEKRLEREEKEMVSLEVVLDSQEEREEVYDLREMEKELDLGEGNLVKVEERKGKVRLLVKNRKVLEKGMDVEEEKWEKVLKGGIKERKRLDKWCGLVLLGMEVERWDMKLDVLKKEFEKEIGVKLMKEPKWVIGPMRARELGLKWVGVVVHVAKESERKRLLEEEVVFDGGVIRVKPFVGKEEVVWCTKCAVVGHSWWGCRKKETTCSVCAVKGHTGFQHRCGRCKVFRQPCVHYRKCAMCGKGHAMKEATEHNCVAVKMEVDRLKSLVY